MSIPEYFLLFSGAGEFQVDVRFQDDRRVQSRRATASEVATVVNPASGLFHEAMTFDEHLCKVDGYDIDLHRKRLIIRVRA